jgi:hypothetical protein
MQCYCYVGEESTYARVALAYLKYRCGLTFGEKGYVKSLASGYDIRYELLDTSSFPLYEREGQYALLELCNRPYFGRRWIIQEVAVSPTAEAICGDLIFDFDWLWSAYALNSEEERAQGKNQLAAMSRFRRNGSGNIVSLAALRSGWSRRVEQKQVFSRDLFDILILAAAFKVSDPKDNIYALLSFAGDSNFFPKVQYQARIEDIYLAFAEVFVTQGRVIDCIQYVSQAVSTLSLPSWVPDWSTEAPTTAFRLTSQYHEVTEEAKIDGKNTVRLTPVSGTIEVDGRSTGRLLSVRQPGESSKKHDLKWVWAELLALKQILARIVYR